MSAGLYVLRILLPSVKDEADANTLLQSFDAYIVSQKKVAFEIGPHAICAQIQLNSTKDYEKLVVQLRTFSEESGLSAGITEQNISKAEKKVFMFDMDSTVIEQEVIDEIAVYAQIQDKVSELTEKAMQGQIDFREALARRVALLKGLPEADVNSVKQNLSLQPGVEETFHFLLSKRQAKIYIISGGFVNFTSYLSEKLGLTGYFANTLEVSAGKLTGKTKGLVIDKYQKEKMLIQVIKKHGVTTSGCVAVGDGANDSLMLNRAGTGIAFCAKPALRECTTLFIQLPDMRHIIPLSDPIVFHS